MVRPEWQNVLSQFLRSPDPIEDWRSICVCVCLKHTFRALLTQSSLLFKADVNHSCREREQKRLLQVSECVPAMESCLSIGGNSPLEGCCGCTHPSLYIQHDCMNRVFPSVPFLWGKIGCLNTTFGILISLSAYLSLSSFVFRYGRLITLFVH